MLTFDRTFFDLLIYACIALGVPLAAYRFYRDMTRPLPTVPPMEGDSGQGGNDSKTDTRPIPKPQGQP